MSELVTRRLAIRGQVQGVWFRESMRLEAARLGVAGWVRNRPDGSVEAVIHGPRQAIEALIAWARRGPDRARVEDLEVSETAGRYEGFEKRPTG